MEALERISEGRAAVEDVGLVSRLLHDPHELVRAQAAEALGFLEATSELPGLVVALDDSSPLVRSYAAASIGLLGGRSYVALLHDRLRAEPSDAARLGFLVALHSLGSRRALTSILDLLTSEDFQVRIAVAKSLSGDILTDANASLIAQRLKLAIQTERSVNARAHLRSCLRRVQAQLRASKK